MTEETSIRDQIARIGTSRFDRGLTAGSSGNILARSPDGGSLMTPTNVSPRALGPARLAHIDPSPDRRSAQTLQIALKTAGERE